MTDKELVAWALANGWTVDAASLYDDEGVEGWRWQDDGLDKEFYTIGPWDEEPDPSDRVLAAMREDYTRSLPPD